MKDFFDIMQLSRKKKRQIGKSEITMLVHQIIIGHDGSNGILYNERIM